MLQAIAMIQAQRKKENVSLKEVCLGEDSENNHETNKENIETGKSKNIGE